LGKWKGHKGVVDGRGATKNGKANLKNQKEVGGGGVTGLQTWRGGGRVQKSANQYRKQELVKGRGLSETRKKKREEKKFLAPEGYVQ